MWPPFLGGCTYIGKESSFQGQNTFLSAYLIITPRASASLNRSFYICLETCFPWRDLEVPTDDERLKQEAGWTNTYRKIAFPVLFASWLGHLVRLICSAHCGSCLDQVSFVKCVFVVTKRISQFHGCLFLCLYQNGWSSWHPSWPWLWFSQFALLSTVEEGKGVLLRDFDSGREPLKFSLYVLAAQRNRPPQHPGDLLEMQNFRPPVSESVWTKYQRFMYLVQFKKPCSGTFCGKETPWLSGPPLLNSGWISWGSSLFWG